MRAVRWTDQKLKSLSLPPGKEEQRQNIGPDLYMYLRRRRSDTAKHWQYRVQLDGSRRWLSLGSFPAVSLAQANAEVLRLKAAHEAAKKGEADHPVIAARQARRNARALPTVAETFELWLEDKKLGSPRKGGAPVRPRTIQVLIENFDLDIRSSIGDAKIAKLSREAVQACIDAPSRPLKYPSTPPTA